MRSAELDRKGPLGVRNGRMWPGTHFGSGMDGWGAKCDKWYGSDTSFMQLLFMDLMEERSPQTLL